MSNEDRERVLRMVAEGKINAEEAADLLEAVEAAQRSQARPVQAPVPPSAPRPPSRRNLVIRVIEGNESQVHVRIPLALARAAGKFMPRQAARHLAEFDIDLEQIIEDLGTTAVEGPLLHVIEGSSQVQISVE